MSKKFDSITKSAYIETKSRLVNTLVKFCTNLILYIYITLRLFSI